MWKMEREKKALSKKRVARVKRKNRKVLKAHLKPLLLASPNAHSSPTRWMTTSTFLARQQGRRNQMQKVEWEANTAQE